MKSFLGYLDDDVPEAIDPEHLTPTQEVRLELRSRPGVYLTLADLARLTGLSHLQVKSAIYALTKQDHINRRVLRARARGKVSGQAYQWRDYPGRGLEPGGEMLPSQGGRAEGRERGTVGTAQGGEGVARMPTSPFRPCLEPGCAVLVPPGRARCANHDADTRSSRHRSGL